MWTNYNVLWTSNSINRGLATLSGMDHGEETDVMECKDQWAQEDPPE